MLVEAGLDWQVAKFPLEYVFDDDGTALAVPDKYALVRTTDGMYFDTVGPNWNLLKNEEAFQLFHDFVMQGDMEMHTGGSLKDGQYVWALAKVSESFDVFGEDRVDSYLLFSNPHQYGKSIDIRFTPIRVVCNNTLTLSLNQATKNGVRIGHRTEFNPDTVKETLGLAHEKFAKYKEMAEFLGSRKVTAESLIQYYNEVFPNTSKDADFKVESYDNLSRNAKLCYDALEVQPGAEYAPGTWWQAFNSVTYITDHVQGRNAENRLHSQWFGYNQARKVMAVNKAVEYATAA